MKESEVKIGTEFNMLIAISNQWRENGRNHVMCRCKCGKEIPARVNSLITNNTKSCGCLQKIKVIEKNFKHGHATRKKRSTEYTSWSLAKNRCEN
jgi:hypothetical protein